MHVYYFSWVSGSAAATCFFEFAAGRFALAAVRVALGVAFVAFVFVVVAVATGNADLLPDIVRLVCLY